LEQLQRLRW